MVSPTAATFYLYKMFGIVLPSQALATPQLCFRELNGHESCWTWPGSAPKPPRPSPEHSPEPCWTWPGSAPKPPGTFFGLLRNLLRNPVKPNLALHQTLPHFLRNLLRNPVEPDLAAPKPPTPSPQPSPEPAPKPPGTFSGTLLNLTWLCTKASQTFSFSGTLSPEPFWTWPGSAPKPPRPSPEPSEPSPEPRWTWPGTCISAHRSYSGLKTPLAYTAGEKTN